MCVGAGVYDVVHVYVQVVNGPLVAAAASFPLL
jgi:hypothetical protein